MQSQTWQIFDSFLNALLLPGHFTFTSIQAFLQGGSLFLHTSYGQDLSLIKNKHSHIKQMDFTD